MKVLVTGGAGFIGRYVTKRLLDLRHVPISFDHFNYETEYLGDVRSYTDVDTAVSLVGGVIHLAGVLGTAETIQKPLPAVEVNLLGSLNVYEACAHHNKPAVTITVGNHFENNPYAISKTAAERFALMYNKERGTKIAVVRGMNAYGARQKAAPVRKIIPNFILPTLRGEPITIYGSGRQVMDMIYVADLADVLVRALMVPHGVYDEVFEAGTGVPTTVNDIAQAVVNEVEAQGIDLKHKPVHVPMRGGESLDSYVMGDPGTLAPLYPHEAPAFRSLEEGLVPTVAWYRAHLND